MNNNDLNIAYSEAISKDEEAIKHLLKSLKGDWAEFNIERFYLAKNKNIVIGCIRTKIFEDGFLELASLAVDKNYQHQGIGSALIKELLSKEEHRPIFLLTSSDKENFYKKFDFNTIEPLDLPNEFKKEYSKIRTNNG